MEREKFYAQHNKYTLPNVITSSYIQGNVGLTGVSSGLAKGILQDKNYIGKNKNKKNILYTPNLSPNLTKYFNNTVGIVSENGGMLSHLAIMARENNIPVVVDFSLSDNIKLGDEVQIDGSDGIVEKI